MKENFLTEYLSKFITVCFTVESDGKKTQIGEGEPLFNVKFNNPIKKTELLTSTSLALGEAYMRGDIEKAAFLGAPDPNTGKLKNGEFLGTLYEHLKFSEE